jgi:hypothetical protein
LDDVLDHFLTILTNGRVTTDGIGAHGDLLTEFPYLGPPSQDRAVKAGQLHVGARAVQRFWYGWKM